MYQIICYFDGACEPRNPGGAMGMGAFIFINGKELFVHSSFESANPNNTNNIAEYKGIIWILKTLIEKKLNRENIIIRGDSKMVINQMAGIYGINKGNYVPYAYEARGYLSSFKSINFEWIPREQNTQADNLSKKELLNHGIFITKR